MNPKYAPLFQPMTIRGVTFKNRILGGPLGNNRSNPGDEIIQENIDYYGALARGGAARVVGGGDAVVNKNGGYMGGMGRVKFFSNPPSMEFSNSIRTYADTVHRYNCLAFVQFFYGGAPGPVSMFRGAKGLGPSAMTFPNGNEVIEMTHADMEQLADDFARCAGMAKSMGIDGCLIHAGHGNLLDQFRAGDFNHRTDEYGGSMENRARFPLMVLRRMREAVGPDFVLEYRTSADEFTPGGITIEETIEFLKLLEQEQLVDLFHITAGRHIDARSNNHCIAPATFPEAPNRGFCRKIKDAGIKTPLVIVNSCANPELAADILASGDADFICLSRQINLADPYYPRKLHEGHEELIDNCLRCHGCYDVTGPCAVNPHASIKSYEAHYPLLRAPVPRKVCVAGGGIAGLKAAYTAAERGHQVILFEQSDQLGGQLRFSDTDTIKTDIRRFKNNMIRRVEAHPNIEIRLNTTVTADTITREQPYGVIAALGAHPRVPELPGVRLPHVLTVLEAYAHPEKLRGTLLMLGSGLTACESALHFNNLGHPVTIVGRRERVCFHERFDQMPTALYNPVPTFLDWFQARKIALYNSCDCIEICEGSVVIRNTVSGERLRIPADTVILAAGMIPNREAAYALQNTAPYFAMAGDCIKPKKIRDAVSTGYWNALEI